MLTSNRQSESGAGVTPAVLEFELPGVVLSSNATHQPRYDIATGQKKWGKSDEWVNWASKVRPYIPQKASFRIADPSFISVSFTFHYDFYHKNGSFRRKDSSNMLKVLLDVISKKLGFDDARVVEGHWKAEHFVGDAWVDCRLQELVQETDHGQ